MGKCRVFRWNIGMRNDRCIGCCGAGIMIRSGVAGTMISSSGAVSMIKSGGDELMISNGVNE